MNVSSVSPDLVHSQSTALVVEILIRMEYHAHGVVAGRTNGSGIDTVMQTILQQTLDAYWAVSVANNRLARGWRPSITVVRIFCLYIYILMLPCSAVCPCTMWLPTKAFIGVDTFIGVDP